MSANKVGDVKAALAGAARTIEAVYSYPHQNHASMEVMNATALYTPERCEVWTPDAERRGGARRHGRRPRACRRRKCEVYKIHLGGGFGRRGVTD